MVKEQNLFESYTGSEPYLFLRYDAADRLAAAGIVNALIDKRFRVCYEEHDKNKVENTDWVAGWMLASHLIIFLISAASQTSLANRNAINYALSKEKKLFCIYLDDQELDGGIAMQLSNVPNARLSQYKSVRTLCDDIILSDSFDQIMRGEYAKIPIQNTRKKRIAITAITAVLVLFLAVGAFITVQRIDYENSLPGQLEKITETDYLDISNEDASIIELLEGKTIYDARRTRYGFNRYRTAAICVLCEALDISGEPGCQHARAPSQKRKPANRHRVAGYVFRNLESRWPPCIQDTTR